jgi:hypothetical protein
MLSLLISVFLSEVLIPCSLLVLSDDVFLKESTAFIKLTVTSLNFLNFINMINLPYQVVEECYQIDHF